MLAARTLDELRDAARALDRIVMWNHWQVPDLYASDEKASYWNRFGMPAVRPKYFTLESAISEWPAWAVTPGGSSTRRSDETTDGAPAVLSYILKRLLLMVPTLIGALTITFIVIQFVPGGPIDQLVAESRASQKGEGGGYRASRDSDAKQIAELKKLYGFDKPAHVRYVEMIGSFLRFDLGRSFLQNKDVWLLIKEKLPVSISLGAWTFLLSYLISIPLGVAKAVREGTRFDTWTSVVVLIGYAIPGFVLGVLLIVLFAGGAFYEWFPLRGLTSDNWSELSWPAASPTTSGT
jgi:hypothetical protein